MTRGIQEQTKAFLDGFNEVVPLEWLQVSSAEFFNLKNTYFASIHIKITNILQN
jgi:hypothetical protein